MDRKQILRRRNRRQLVLIAAAVATITMFPHIFYRHSELQVGQSSASAARQLRFSGAKDVSNGIAWFRYVRASEPVVTLHSETLYYTLADGTGLEVWNQEEETTHEMRVKMLCHYPCGLGKESYCGSTKVGYLMLSQAPVWYWPLIWR